MSKRRVITKDTDICNIEDYVEIISGRDSDSTSPTDIWIVEFKKNTFYNDDKIEYGFLKIFIEPRSIDTPHRKYIMDELHGLNYEINIYKDVIRPLIDYNICTNFVKYLSGGKNCTYENLFNILKSALLINGGQPTDDIIKEVLNRNIYYMQSNMDGRLSINNDKMPHHHKFNPPNPNFRYNMILNSQIPSGSLKLSQLLKNSYRILSNNSLQTVFFPIIFQIAAGCYAMSLSKMLHNDLHAGNIFLEQLKTPIIQIYIINNKKYVIQSEYKVYIYDFDRSYCERFGDNLLLKDLCDTSSQCNEYIENKDFIKIMCYLFMYFQHPFRGHIIDILAKDPSKFQDSLTDMFRHDCFFQTLVKGNTDLFKTEFNDMSYIIEILGTYIPDVPDKTYKIDVKNINICNKDFFNENGTIIMKKYEKIYNDTLDDVIKYSKSSSKRPSSPKRASSRRPPSSSRTSIPKRISSAKRPSNPKRASSRRPPSPKRASSPKKQKPCTENKIRNPKSGKCVSKTGVIGKKIMKEMGGSKRASSPRRASPIRRTRPKKQKPCNSNQVRNPDTRRCVLKTSPLGKKILKEMGGSKSKKRDSSTSDTKYTAKTTLADGNCLFSSIFRSLKDKNLLEKFCKCIKDIDCTNEKKFISTFRMFITEKDHSISLRYIDIFNNMIKNFKEPNFEENFKEIIKYFGDTRTVLIKFNKENKFEDKYLKEFISEIENVIVKNKTYVGEIELFEISKMIKRCDIGFIYDTNLKNFIKFIKKQNKNEINNSLYLILNQEKEHWEYI